MDSSVISLGIILMYSVSGKYVEIWTTENDRADGGYNWCCKQGELLNVMEGYGLESINDILGMELICDNVLNKPALFLKSPSTYELSFDQKNKLSNSLYEALPRAIKKQITLDQFKHTLFNA